jgi:hypothetical protein
MFLWLASTFATCTDSCMYVVTANMSDLPFVDEKLLHLEYLMAWHLYRLPGNSFPRATVFRIPNYTTYPYISFNSRPKVLSRNPWKLSSSERLGCLWKSLLLSCNDYQKILICMRLELVYWRKVWFDGILSTKKAPRAAMGKHKVR